MSGTAESKTTDKSNLDVEAAVKERYSAASQASEAALCCPVDYNPDYLKVLPQELIDRDYGCGDPSKYVKEGETVLDLGSGGGKICYIASQIVGSTGRVIGVDMNLDMLALAREYQSEIASRIGWDNVEFHRGRIQDLALSLDRIDQYLATQQIDSVDGWMKFQDWTACQKLESPMIADHSVDVVVSNCVLNLVRPDDRRQLFSEILRVLKRGGRAVISDIISDEFVPEHMRNDPKLWSGCISGAFEEKQFLESFIDAGFYGIEIVNRPRDPWAIVEGIEFRSVTVQAWKGKDGPCMDHNEAVIYRGPWKSVTDDDGHVLRRGARTAVCRKTFDIYTSEPYKDQIEAVPPYTAVSEADAKPFDCRKGAERPPQVTKQGAGELNLLPVDDCCGPSGCC